MKKILLSVALAVMGMASSHAAVDGQTYQEVDGIKIVNQWIFDRVHTGAEFDKSPIANNYARTAVMSNGVIYVARSQAQLAVVGKDSIQQAVIYRFDAATGKSLPQLDVTLAGKPYGGLLAVNSIGVDNFGHIWVAPYTSEKLADIPFYSLNVQSGELSLVATLNKGEKVVRTDYYDVIGDITVEKAQCNIMSAGAQSPTVYRWHADQGSKSFEGGFEGDKALDFSEFYPQTVTQWGYAPVVKMVLGSDDESKYSGENFYIDGFSSAPILYNNTGGIISSFEKVDKELYPEAGTNGVTEFNLEGKNFMIYSKAQYSGVGHGCQANIVELGEGATLDGMKLYWQIPADSLGQQSDGGNRVHSFNVEYGTENGQPCVTVFTYKCQNGMAIYKIGKGVTAGGSTIKKGDVNQDGKIDVTDVTEAINMILKKTRLNLETADMNGDGKVDETDVNAIINIILKKA